MNEWMKEWKIERKKERKKNNKYEKDKNSVLNDLQIGNNHTREQTHIKCTGNSFLKKERKNEWMNEWMNEWKNER